MTSIPANLENNARTEARKLEEAYKSNNQNDAYTTVMQEITHDLNSFSGNKQATEIYTGSLTNQLEADGYLPRVSLFEAQRQFVNINPANAKQLIDGVIEGKNPVQQTLLGQAEELYNQTDDGRKVRAGITDGGDPAPAPIDWNNRDAGYQFRSAFADIFAVRSDGPSLYDRIRNDQGDISKTANHHYSGKEIGHFAYLLWVAYHKRKPRGLKAGQVLSIDRPVMSTPDLSTLFRE